MQLPSEYFTTVLGKWKKYSSCYYMADDDTIDTAEENMLRALFQVMD
jgi:cyclopropane fatty-acyl-phospholipid synthase-like methyltransferase